MLIMVEKCFRGGFCHAIYRHANNKYMKDFDRNKELSCFMCWDLNKSHCGQCHKDYEYVVLSRLKIHLNPTKTSQKTTMKIVI